MDRGGSCLFDRDDDWCATLPAGSCESSGESAKVGFADPMSLRIFDSGGEAGLPDCKRSNVYLFPCLLSLGGTHDHRQTRLHPRRHGRVGREQPAHHPPHHGLAGRRVDGRRRQARAELLHQQLPGAGEPSQDEGSGEGRGGPLGRRAGRGALASPARRRCTSSWSAGWPRSRGSRTRSTCRAASAPTRPPSRRWSARRT